GLSCPSEYASTGISYNLSREIFLLTWLIKLNYGWVWRCRPAPLRAGLGIFVQLLRGSDNGRDALGVERLHGEQLLSHGADRGTMSADQFASLFVAFHDELADLTIDLLRGRFADARTFVSFPGIPGSVVRERTERGRHAELAHHPAGDIGRAFDVVARAAC